MENENIPKPENEQLEPQVLKHEVPEKDSKTLVHQSVFHRGPLPAPETLKKYDEIIPHGAERIMAMAEKQQEHRIEMEKIVISAQVRESNKGQYFAFTIGITGLFLGFICIILGQGVYGIIFIGGTLVSLVSIFIVGKKNITKDLESKRHNSKE